jgi:hypothetical protein
LQAIQRGRRQTLAVEDHPTDIPVSVPDKSPPSNKHGKIAGKPVHAVAKYRPKRRFSSYR